MKRSRRAAIRWAVYALAVIIVLGVFLKLKMSENAALSRQVALGYDHAFSELTTAAGKLDTALRKAGYASSPAMVGAMCAEAYAEAMEARAALGVLPIRGTELNETASFLTRAGDYVYFLARSAASGGGLGDEERENLIKLEAGAAAVTDTLSGLYAQLLSGGVSISELERAEDEIARERGELDTGLEVSFKRLEAEFPELPSLIYDGPFSEHLRKPESKLLSGAEEVTEERARKTAAAFIGRGEDEVDLAYTLEGDMPVYVYTRYNGGEVATIEVTRRGGEVLFYGTNRQAGAPVLSADECVRTAQAFLERRGLTTLKPTYWEIESGDLVINFAHNEGEVVCYPDLVKVSVAMDTGSVSGFEALGYLMSHTERSLPAPALSAADCMEKLSPALTVKETRLAVIPTSGQYEVLCHEFLCEDDASRRCLVYVNAETGAEEKILLLIEDESGTLTM